MNTNQNTWVPTDAELERMFAYKAGSTNNTKSLKKLLTLVKTLSILGSTNDGYGNIENESTNNHKQQNQHENFGSHKNYDPGLFDISDWGRQLIATVF